MNNSSKMKAVIAGLLLALASASAPFVFSYSYLCIGGAIYVADSNSFGAGSVSALIFGILMLAVFFTAYIPSLVYLCRRAYRLKRWMVFIPISVSILIAILSIVCLWRNFQWE